MPLTKQNYWLQITELSLQTTTVTSLLFVSHAELKHFLSLKYVIVKQE